MKTQGKEKPRRGNPLAPGQLRVGAIVTLSENKHTTDRSSMRTIWEVVAVNDAHVRTAKSKLIKSKKTRRRADKPGREPMRKVTLTLAIALLFVGPAVLTADAQTSSGANRIAADTQNFTLIKPAACRGWGPYCRPGFVRACGRYRCWCRPC
jgi:hypothetical protein